MSNHILEPPAREVADGAAETLFPDEPVPGAAVGAVRFAAAALVAS
jgi:hypothetical protein